MKIIGIKVEDQERGEWVLEMLRIAVAAERVSLDDIALVTKDEDGKVRIHQTKDVTVKKGAKRGALVGALVGLAAPPVLGAAAVGVGIGALWGKFRDRGIDDDLMQSIGGMIAGNEAVVFALGDNSSIEAIDARVRELSKGDMTTITVDTDNEALVREAAVEVPVQTEMPVRAPYS
jgi:uncharacterized membrane protein